MARIFELSSLLVLPAWALMIFLPRARATRWLMRSAAVPALLALLYGALVLPQLAGLLPALLRPELPGLQALLGTPEGATIAWVHFLAFDLFVGRWAYLDSQARGLSPWAMGPVLWLTLMFGPLGLLAYLLLRRLTPGAAQGEGAPGARRSGLPAPLRRLWAVSPALVGTAVVHLGLLALFLAAGLVDERLVTGQPVWVKPAKFAASISLYTLTLAWLLSHVEGRRRAVRAVGAVTAVGMAIEILIIGGQAARGVPSHFNTTSALNGVLFSVMGVSILVVWLAGFVALWLLVRQRFADRALGLALRLGLFVSLVGAGLGGLMTQPTAAQRAELAGGTVPRAMGAHAVGAPDDGAGLPGVGWSTRGGDLRVPHFLGLHAMQALPLLALWLLRRERRARAQLAAASSPGALYAGLVFGLDPAQAQPPRAEDAVHSARSRLALMRSAALGYLGLVGVLTLQALQGEPLLQPGPVTLTALGALAGVTAASAGVGLLLARRAPRLEPLRRGPLLSVRG
jgi:hypothetical protein